MMTIMYFSPMSVVLELIAQTVTHVWSYAWCPFFGMWDSFEQTVEHHGVTVAIPCRSFRVVNVASLVLWFFPPASVHGGIYGNVVLRFVVPQSTVV